MGEVDTLVYNASLRLPGDVEGITVEQFTQAWQVDALGGFLCACAVILRGRIGWRVCWMPSAAGRRDGWMTRRWRR